MVELSELMLGTLVLNKEKQIEQVKSLQYSRRKRRCIGAHFLGEINGRPASEFEELPVTEPLLAALGWKIEPDEEKKLVYAWPSTDQFYPKSMAENFKVQFLLADNVVKGFSDGAVVTTNGADDLLQVSDFVHLDRLFLENFSQRMVIDFIPEEYNMDNISC